MPGPRRQRVRGEDRHAKAQAILGLVHSTRGRVPVTGSLVTRPSRASKPTVRGLLAVLKGKKIKTPPF